LAVKVLRVEEAVGKKLAYDVTLVTPDKMQVPFRKGHIIREEDVEQLKTSGHYYVYVTEGSYSYNSFLHEDEAVLELAKVVTGGGCSVFARPGGKALIRSAIRGTLIVHPEGLKLVNEGGEFALITREPWIGVERGEAIAIVDLIPFYVKRSVIEAIKKKLSNQPVIEVKSYKHLKFGLIITGTEIYEGKVPDNASPVVKEKVEKYGGEIAETVILPDDKEAIKRALKNFLTNYDGVIVTGGMSVDPTDYTPKAIEEVAEEIVAYGIPIKPTTMSMISYWKSKPIMGVSSGIVYFRDWNVLDVILPKIMIGVKWSREDILNLALGGLHDVYLKRLKI